MVSQTAKADHSQGLVEPHREGDDIVAMAADILAVPMIAAMVVSSQQMLLLGQPTARFHAVGDGIFDVAREQPGRQIWIPRCVELHRGRIEPPQARAQTVDRPGIGDVALADH